MLLFYTAQSAKPTAYGENRPSGRRERFPGRCLAEPLAAPPGPGMVGSWKVLHFPDFRRFAAMADWVEAGSKAPDFSLLSDQGEKVKLSAFGGQPVVLYFYPKDDTPGCTREACAFRDRKTALAKLGAVVFGVSADDVTSHEKFRDKYKINFPLLADTDHRVAEKYGAWREKNLYGKKSMGIQRSTFLIGRDGKIARVWKKVNVDGHDEEVIAAIKELGRTN
jgi:peroxiredoxin Q/BCP